MEQEMTQPQPTSLDIGTAIIARCYKLGAKKSTLAEINQLLNLFKQTIYEEWEENATT